MHPDVRRFNSEAVCVGRLIAEPGSAVQRLALNEAVYPELKQTGISYVPVAHDVCSERSQEEAQVVLELVTSLLT